MSKGEYQIPFDKDGNQLHYPETWRGCEWRENATFDDALRFVCYRRGRSAAYFAFQRGDGTEVTMFLKDFEEAVPLMERGLLRGTFRFVKRGQNYGVQLFTV